MKILITTPAPPRSRYGNRVTALRWARILKEIGHHATVSQVYEDGDYDLLVALHARRSYPSINRWRHLHPDKPLIVALSGTDLYRDLKQSKVARKSLEMATRIIALQPKAFDDLSTRLHTKTRIIYQSAHSVCTGRTRRILARSHLCVLSSRMEGGASAFRINSGIRARGRLAYFRHGRDFGRGLPGLFQRRRYARIETAIDSRGS